MILVSVVPAKSEEFLPQLLSMRTAFSPTACMFNGSSAMGLERARGDAL
jgi:hypothetical protein